VREGAPSIVIAFPRPTVLVDSFLRGPIAVSVNQASRSFGWAGFRRENECLHLVSRFLLHMRERMTVHLERERDLRVTEPFGNDLRIFSGREKEGRPGVSQSVRFGVWYTSRLKQFAPIASDYSTVVQWLTVSRCKYKAVFAP
jgi:hypothetical protein